MKSVDVAKLAALVRKHLDRTGMTQSAFASVARVNPSVITRLLQPKPPNVRPRTIEHLLAALAPDLRAAAHKARDSTNARENARLRVFVSSTFLEQAERRSHVREAIELLGLEPVAMERFAATSRSTAETCVELVHTCDLYLGIVAFRYGGSPPGDERSFTEIEHDAAVEAGLDRLVFAIDRSRVRMNEETDADPLPDRWPRQEKLREFVQRVSDELTVAPFASDAELVNRIWHSLSDWLARRGIEPVAERQDLEPELRAEAGLTRINIARGND